MPDLVMVPSFKSATGWQYVDTIGKKQREILRKLPGLRGHLKSKLKISKDDPNHSFPDTSNESLQTNGLLRNKITGLQENFKITQRGGGLKPAVATKNKSFLDMKSQYKEIRKYGRQSSLNQYDLEMKKQDSGQN